MTETSCTNGPAIATWNFSSSKARLVVPASDRLVASPSCHVHLVELGADRPQGCDLWHADTTAAGEGGVEPHQHVLAVGAASQEPLYLGLVRQPVPAYGRCSRGRRGDGSGSSLISGLIASAIAVADKLKGSRRRGADPGDCVVAFRASPRSDAPEDARRIFDALNGALAQGPGMALALTGAKGGERLAKPWARQKRAPLVLARADFERLGRAAPFRANDRLMAPEPVCVLVLPETLGAAKAAGAPPFGPAQNLAEQAADAACRATGSSSVPQGERRTESFAVRPTPAARPYRGVQYEYCLWLTREASPGRNIALVTSEPGRASCRLRLLGQSGAPHG